MHNVDVKETSGHEEQTMDHSEEQSKFLTRVAKTSQGEYTIMISEALWLMFHRLMTGKEEAPRRELIRIIGKVVSIWFKCREPGSELILGLDENILKRPGKLDLLIVCPWW
jgi:hypothetical protein